MFNKSVPDERSDHVAGRVSGKISPLHLYELTNNNSILRLFG